MNPDKEVYHIDTAEKARGLYNLLNPDLEYISSMEHAYDDYVRRNPDLMKLAETGKDPDDSPAEWLRGVNELWQIGQRHYDGHGKREGRLLRSPHTFYRNGQAVPTSEMPTIGNYYFKDGTQFNNDMPS